MKYRLVITSHAEQQIDRCLQYVSTAFYSKQGASAIIDDIESAFLTLQTCAESFAYCEDPHLRSKGYLSQLSFVKQDNVMLASAALFAKSA